MQNASVFSNPVLITRFHCINILYCINPLIVDTLQEHNGKDFYCNISQEFYMGYKAFLPSTAKHLG